MSPSTDRIEKQLVLRAPVSRVWKAIADHEEFGAWFGLKTFAPFSAGAVVRAQITNPPEFSHFVFEMHVERVEPERLFSFRWHPYAIEPGVDYSQEPTTLVEFLLEAVDGGTRLTLTESGFDALPAARREKAFPMNDQGWTIQVERIARHVASS